MSDGETVYLVMVVVGMCAFVAVLAWASVTSERRRN